MIFTHYLFSSPIDFSDNIINRLVVENSSFLGQLIEELSNQINGSDGRFILSDHNMELELSRKMVLIIDPFSLDFSCKDIVSNLQKVIANNLESEDNYLETRALYTSLIDYVINKAIDVELNVDVDEITSQSLLKCISLGVIVPDNIVEKVCEYSRLICVYGGKQIIVLVNFDQFVSGEGYSDFIHQVNYYNIPILLIETTVKLDNIPCKVLDHDLCELNFKPR